MPDVEVHRRLNSLDGKAAAVRGLATVILAVILLNDKVAPESTPTPPVCILRWPQSFTRALCCRCVDENTK